MARKTPEKKAENNIRLRQKSFSDDIVLRAQKIIDGIDTEYDPIAHIPVLLATFKLGKDIAAFCSQADISRKTFFEWVKKYPEFNLAYEKAKELAREWYEMQGQHGIVNPMEFNAVAWSMQMRNRFGYTDRRKVQIKNFAEAKSHLERLMIVFKEISNGELTLDEARSLVDVIVSAVKVDEITEIKKDLEMMKNIMGGNA